MVPGSRRRNLRRDRKSIYRVGKPCRRCVHFHQDKKRGDWRAELHSRKNRRAETMEWNLHALTNVKSIALLKDKEEEAKWITAVIINAGGELPFWKC